MEAQGWLNSPKLSLRLACYSAARRQQVHKHRVEPRAQLKQPDVPAKHGLFIPEWNQGKCMPLVPGLRAVPCIALPSALMLWCEQAMLGPTSLLVPRLSQLARGRALVKWMASSQPVQPASSQQQLDRSKPAA